MILSTLKFENYCFKSHFPYIFSADTTERLTPRHYYTGKEYAWLVLYKLLNAVIIALLPPNTPNRFLQVKRFLIL